MMAVWDFIKKATKTAKCASGWHSGEWKPVYGKPECHVEKECTDCRKHVTSVKHRYGDWNYNNFGSCDAVRFCVHCEHIDKSIEHTFKKYDKDDNCFIIEKCDRCNEKRNSGRHQHNWKKIFNKELKNRDGKRACQDCGYVES